MKRSEHYVLIALEAIILLSLIRIAASLDMSELVLSFIIFSTMAMGILLAVHLLSLRRVLFMQNSDENREGKSSESETKSSESESERGNIPLIGTSDIKMALEKLNYGEVDVYSDVVMFEKDEISYVATTHGSALYNCNVIRVVYKTNIDPKFREYGGLDERDLCFTDPLSKCFFDDRDGQLWFTCVSCTLCTQKEDLTTILSAQLQSIGKVLESLSALLARYEEEKSKAFDDLQVNNANNGVKS